MVIFNSDEFRKRSQSKVKGEMKKMKTIKIFIIGFIFGAVLLSGVNYASDHLNIAVKFLQIPYWYDGKDLKLDQNKLLLSNGEVAPTTIHYKGVNYVPIRSVTEAFEKDVSWDDEYKRVLIRSVKQLNYKEIKPENMSIDILNWVELSLNKELVQRKYINGNTYILITLGVKNSGGYDIKLIDIKHFHNELQISVERIEPSKGALVTEGISYPYKLIKIEGIFNQPLDVKDNDHDYSFPQLQGIAFIPSLMKETKSLILFDHQIRQNQIRIHGLANVFEGILYYSLVDKDGRVLEHEVLQSSGVSPNWGYFQKYISFKEEAEPVFLKIKTHQSDYNEESIEIMIDK